MKGWIKDIVIAVIIAFLVIQFVQPTIVQGRSMQPTLYENNYIFLNKQAYRFGEPERGDIIVCHSDLKTPQGEEKLLIKRVIGLPGDTISIEDGVVYLNGTILDEPYLLEKETMGTQELITVQEGYLFIMGDNRQASEDSRSEQVGCVAIHEVIGKAFFRLYPSIVAL